MDIDDWRKGHLSFAELVDAWRIVPRMVVAGYAYMMYEIVKWYMNLKPSIMEGCDLAILGEKCIIEAPSTQHAALVTAVIGIAAAVFGLYGTASKKWNGFIPWNKTNEEKVGWREAPIQPKEKDPCEKCGK